MIQSIHLRAPFTAATVFFRRSSTGLSGSLVLEASALPPEQAALWHQAMGMLGGYLLEDEAPLALVVEPGQPVTANAGDPEADPPVPATTLPGFSIAITSRIQGEERTRSISPTETTRAFVASMWSALNAQIGD